MVEASPQQVIEGVVKVTDGVIGRYRYVGFEVDPNLIERYKKEACRRLANMLKWDLPEFDVSEGDVKRIVAKVVECEEDSLDVFRKYNIELDWYYPTANELAVEEVLRKVLQSIPDAPPDPQVEEESGYGLPEYSLYRNYDARSWCGRWYWSGGGSEDICWALIHEEDVCDEVSEMINSLELRAREKDKQLLFAVWIR